VQQYRLVYERCSEPARRAIFFAIYQSRLRESQYVDSVDLLRGLMRDESSRVNAVFGLRELFPLYCGCPPKFASSEEVPKPDSILTDEVKRILAWTGWEADAVGDYWIDNEHLLLGIIHEERCLAGQYLLKAGFTLRSARRTMLENKSSRPDYGPISQWWALQSPWDRFRAKSRLRKYQREGD
jgi:ATP-dependent Clp protease ATP-binding subunit ClpA